MSDFTSLPAELPVPVDDGAADHLPDRAAPSVTLAASGGGQVALDRLGSGRTIIYVYPMTGRPGVALPEGWDDIPGARGCTPETCGFRDHFAELRTVGVGSVYGLSRQDREYQREVVDRLQLPFEMLADPEGMVGEALDLPAFEAGGMVLYKRLTMVIRHNTIEHVFYPIFPPDAHALQVLTWLRENPAG